VITTPDCRIEKYLRSVGARYDVVAAITGTREYRAIEMHYGERRTARSNVPLIRHVDEGLFVLTTRGVSEPARRAFCLHPRVQEDADLATTFPRIGELSDDPRVIALALEYRNIANATLSQRARSPAPTTSR
jgi:hypothetical protein